MKIPGRYSGDVSGPVIAGFIETAAGLTPELASEHALGMLVRIVEDSVKGEGMFKPSPAATFPMLTVSEHGKFDVVDVDTPDKAREGMQLFATKIAEATDALVKENTGMKAELQKHADAEKAIQDAEKTRLIGVLASAHASYSSDAAQKALLGMDLGVIKTLADGLDDSQHSAQDGADDGRVKYTLDSQHTKGPLPTSAIGLNTPLSMDMHMALRADLKGRIGRDLFPQRSPRISTPDATKKGGK